IAGGTVHAACKHLNALGHTTTTGREWQPSSLRATLRSPKIAALSALGGQIIGPGQWQPVLDRDTWEQVCAAISTRNPKNPTPRTPQLSGLVGCGVDGRGRRLYRGLRAGEPIYRRQTELKANGHVAISAARVEEMVEAFARERLADPRVRDAVSR